LNLTFFSKYTLYTQFQCSAINLRMHYTQFAIETDETLHKFGLYIVWLVLCNLEAVATSEN
jgi:hypothetical protein